MERIYFYSDISNDRTDSSHQLNRKLFYLRKVNEQNLSTFGSSYYRPQTKLRERNVFTPVCDSVHGRGGSLSSHIECPSMIFRRWSREAMICKNTVQHLHPCSRTVPGFTARRTQVVYVAGLSILRGQVVMNRVSIIQ